MYALPRVDVLQHQPRNMCMGLHARAVVHRRDAKVDHTSMATCKQQDEDHVAAIRTNKTAVQSERF
jgi:hypothetical protein